MLVYFVNHSSAVEHLGGSEKSMLRLIDDWVAMDPNLEPFFITKAPRGLLIEELERRGWGYSAFRYRGWAVPPHDSHADKLGFFAAEDYLATSQILRVMDKRRPDLVVTNTLVAPWGAFASKVLGVPHAWMVREFGDLDHGLAFTQGRERTLADIGLLSEVVFANSEAIRDHLSPFIPRDKLSIMYPQVDHALISSQAQELITATPFRLNDPGLRITVVGRLTPSKGQWRVIEALGRLKARGSSASVCFVGGEVDAHHIETLRKRARELKVGDRVQFVGEQMNPFPFVLAADVCVTPSTNEAFGRSTLEYMWLGKPVIATATGGSAELVVDGSNGFVFDPTTPDALADHLQLYIDDPGLIGLHGGASLLKAADIGSLGRDNLAAIHRMKEAVGQPAYKLPEIARFWFDLPALSGAQGPRRSVTARYLGRVLIIRARNFVKNPVGASRRRFRAWKNRSG